MLRTVIVWPTGTLGVREWLNGSRILDAEDEIQQQLQGER
jgi:hypothetical protein